MAAWASKIGPIVLVGMCQRNSIWSSWLLRDLREVPFWFADVVRDHLYLRTGGTDADHERKLKRFKRQQARDNFEN